MASGPLSGLIVVRPYAMLHPSPNAMNCTRHTVLLALLILLVGTCSSVGQFTLLPRGSLWKFYSAGDPGLSWAQTHYNDSSWSSGPAQLGYGEGDELTVIHQGDPEDAPTTVYFRRPIFVTNRFEIYALTLRIVSDDGAVVYMNGKEILRRNMPAGSVNFSTEALSNIETNENTFAQFAIGDTRLVNGTNIISVEVHQHPANRTDCSFDLELIANMPLRPPVITLTNLTNGQFFASGPLVIQTTSGDLIGHVVAVDFFANGVLVGKSTNEPFSLEWTPFAAGGYSIGARARNELGLFGDSKAIQIYYGEAPQPKLMIEPYLQSGSPTGMVVRWRTDWYSDSVVRYGTNLNQLTQAVTNSQPVLDHEVTLTGLLPDTRYFYSVGSSTGTLAAGSSCYLRTSPTNTRPVRVWVVGDSGTGDDNAASVRDAYYAFNGTPSADLFLMLGDNVYGNSFGWEYQKEIFGMYHPLARNTPIWPTLGNHDGGDTLSEYGNMGKPHLDIFTLPKNGECGGVPSGSELYYSFDYANIHFVCLDAFLSSKATNGPMFTWLAADLAATDKDWIIGFWHHPVYSWGSHNSDNESFSIEMRERALPLLEAYGVDLVMCGHSHEYERSYLIDGHYGHSSTLQPSMVLSSTFGRKGVDGPYRKPSGGLGARQGAVYVVCGCSGAGGADEGFPLHPVMALNHGGFGSMVMDVNGLELTARFLRPSGAIDDIFTIDKSQPSAVQPALTLDKSTNGFVLSWPTSIPAYLLESKTNLSDLWSLAPEGSSSNGRRKITPVSAALTNRFFRLKANP